MRNEDRKGKRIIYVLAPGMSGCMYNRAYPGVTAVVYVCALSLSFVYPGLNTCTQLGWKLGKDRIEEIFVLLEGVLVEAFIVCFHFF